MNSEHEITAAWGNKRDPIVSVICPTYNHERYIRKTIESILLQKTDFPFEILVHDDASTDSTASIVAEYEKSYPHIVRAIYQQENQYSKGYKIQPLVMPRARGKYIAFCEGDDYWTDSHKLLKQVSVLEKNSDIAVCGHWCINVDGQDVLLKNQNLTGRTCPEYFGMKEALSGTPLHTSTWMYRRVEWQNHQHLKLLNALPAGDDPIMLMLLAKGRGYCLSEFCSAYRLHDGGSWSTKPNYRKSFDMLRFYVASLKLIPSELYFRQYLNVMVATLETICALIKSMFKQRSSQPAIDIFQAIRNQKTIRWYQLLNVLLAASVLGVPLISAIRIRRKIKILCVSESATDK
jgi:glycosyltransferase involved in cell wall biosynthesis